MRWYRVDPPKKRYPHKYRERGKTKTSDLYDEVPSVPEGCKWKHQPGYFRTGYVTLFSMGCIYKLARELATGKVTYYKLRDTGPDKSPSEKIDAEPVKKGQVRYPVGAPCWFIGAAARVGAPGRWYLCRVVERGPDTITISPVTGWDADRFVEWPYPDPLQFSSSIANDGDLFRRLRPLKDRRT